MTEFRPLPKTDRPQFRSMLRYAFTPESGPTDDEDAGDDEEPTLFDRYGLYDGDDLVSGCKLYAPEARVRDEITTIGGLGAVATRPEFRGQGYGKQLCQRMLAEYREREIGLVALWPFSTPFYRRMGWGTANDVTRYELPPRALPTVETVGQMRRIDGEDWQALVRVEQGANRDVSLSLRRSEAWWRERTLSNWNGNGESYCYGYERDGDLQGYLVYTVADDDSGTLSVSGFDAADEEAYRALLDFLAGHGAQIERIVVERALGTDLLARVDDPAAVDCHVESGPMVRLTDVTALEAVEWPAGEVECTLSVSDPLVANNDGGVRLSVADGRATVEPIGESADAVDATVGIGTLSQLAVGTYGIDDAERFGDLRIADESVRDPLATVFRPRTVGLREFF